MKAGPSRIGARRPEKRVTARSKAPQKKWTGLHLPTKLHCEAVSTCAARERIRHHRFAYAGS